ncbi:MAG: beta-ribofuranosylaminobenzene 5'-phosphate synthase family protein [Acidibrevibacterium sp.]|uniref:beta-ribofuranosylaminobenzene 5'-phosphate synthase family protein n=1 Tax=Acidibrevibacterium sp. TaxID=2606776 RepID=UPI003D0328F9
MMARGTIVEVTTTARLHLGFFDLCDGPGRRFGSLGLALDGPRTRLTIGFADHSIVDGEECARARRYLATLVAAHGLSRQHALTIREAIPPHAGLGSGTQLALAIGAGLRALHGLPADPRQDAAWLGRGARSGIGIALFDAGGVAVDGGRGDRAQPPPLLARLPVPADWRVILVLDRGRAGLSGAGEVAAFAALPAMAEPVSAALCRLALMAALPALAEDDIAAFGAAITRMQEILGDHFAPAQGARFASPAVAAALARLAAAEAVGIGQSSWGPSGFAFVRGDAAAAALASEAAAPGLEIHVCRARNEAAAVSIT